MGVGNVYEKYDYPSEIEEVEDICKDCRNKNISKRFQTTTIKLCEKCYLKRKKIRFHEDLAFKGISQIDEITPTVFLGNIDGAKNRVELHRLGITNILAVGYYLNEFFPKEFKYKTIEIEDNINENIIFHFVTCIEFIDKSEKCFVHCRAGTSRSAAVVIAYIMVKYKKKYFTARKFVEDKRRIQPNESFVQQLKNFEEILISCNYNWEVVKEFFNSFVKK